MSTLHLLRHAKTQTASATGRDFDRALKRVGREDAHAAAQWLAETFPERLTIVSSTALRAMQTAKIVAATLDVPESDIVWEADIYAAMPGQILAIINRYASESSLLAVGHNPGFEMLARGLAAEGGEPIRLGMPTSGIASLERLHGDE